MSVPRAQAFPAEGIFGVQGNLPEAKTCAWVLTLTAGRLHVPLFLSVMGFKQQLPVERHRGHTDGFVPPVGRGISAPGLRALPTISTHTQAQPCNAQQLQNSPQNPAPEFYHLQRALPGPVPLSWAECRSQGTTGTSPTRTSGHTQSQARSGTAGEPRQ